MIQVFIGGELCDLAEESSVEISKSITELSDPSQRTSSRTKTINIMGTPSMNKLFGFLFVPAKDNNYATFNPKIKVPAYITMNGGTILDGWCKLNSITNLDEEIKYEVVIYSSEKSLFFDMADSFIRGNQTSANDVDLSTSANSVILTTSGANQTFTDSFVLSSNVCAPYYIENGQGVELTDFPYYKIGYRQQRLAVKFKHIVDRIFETHGHAYQSDFLSTSGFAKYVYIDTHKTQPSLSETEISNRSAYVGRNTTTSGDSYTTSGQYAFNVEFSDPANLFATNTFTSPETRYYRLKGDIRYQAGVLFASGRPLGVSVFNHTLNFYVRRNGVVVSTQTRTPTQIVTGAQTSGESVYLDPESLLLDVAVDLAAGDTCDVVVVGTFTNSTPSTPGAIGVLKQVTGAVLNIVPNSNEIAAGTALNINSVIATKHKQRDFLMDVFRMFNMLVLYDQENNRYKIEPRDAFYTTNVFDITNQVDRSKDISLVPSGELIWKELKLTYTPDKDYFHDLYIKNYGEVYGEQNVYNDNEFASENTSVKIDMTSPILVSNSSNYPKLQHVYTFNGSTRTAIDGRQRFAIWGGWKDTNVSYDVTGRQGETIVTGYGYPLVGEWDDLNSPTFTGLFGTPREIFYTTIASVSITLNNHYAYYANMISNQVDINAKIIRCSTYSYEVASSLSLDDLVLFDGVLCTVSQCDIIGDNIINLTLVQYER